MSDVERLLGNHRAPMPADPAARLTEEELARIAHEPECATGCMWVEDCYADSGHGDHSTCTCIRSAIIDRLASLSSSPTDGGGICGHTTPGIVGVLVCERPPGHVGWHGNAEGTNWNDAPPPAPVDDSLREALEDAAESLRGGFVAEARQVIDAALNISGRAFCEHYGIPVGLSIRFSVRCENDLLVFGPLPACPTPDASPEEAHDA